MRSTFSGWLKLELRCHKIAMNIQMLNNEEVIKEFQILA